MKFELHRKSNKIICLLKRAFSPSYKFNHNCGHITIFHDYERQYCDKSVIDYSDKGIEKILDIEEKYKISATFNIVGKLINDVPLIIARLLSDGHEIASHSHKHSIMTKLSKAEIINDIKQTKDSFYLRGIQLNGFRSPQSRWSFQQMAILLNYGFKWSAENDHSKFPYILTKNKDNILIRMPIAMDDWGYESSMLSPAVMLQKLKKCVDTISNEKCYGAIGFHPWVQGKEKDRLSVFEEFIANISERKDIKVLPFNDALSVYSKILE